MIKPHIDGGEPARRDAAPRDLVLADLPGKLLDVPEVDGGDALDLRPLEARRSLPLDVPTPAAIVGAFADDADAPAEVGLPVGTHCLEGVEPVAKLDPLDGSGRGDIEPEGHLVVLGPYDVSHDGAAARLLRDVAQVRVAVKEHAR